MDLKEDVLTTSEAARELGLSAVRVRQFMDAGRLAHTRTRLGRLIARTELERFRRERSIVRKEASPPA